MKRANIASFILITLLCLSPEALAQASPEGEQSIPPAPVQVAKVEERKVQRPVLLAGAVEPRKTSVIASEISGIIKSFPSKEGTFVKAGEVIALFRTDDLAISLREARAAKREADARYRMAGKSLTRFKELGQKGIVSAQQLDDSESEAEAWAAKVAQFDAQIDRLEYDLARAKITAPFSGYVTREYTEVGEWVSKGGAVVELIETDTVEIKINAPERYVSLIKVGDKVNFTLDALPRMSIEGIVASIVPQADGQARTFPVKIRVDNKNQTIKSGMVARVSFLIGEPATVKLVPKDAVVEFNNATLVFVVANGAATPVPVARGTAYGGMVEVNGQIQTGQDVITRGNERLQPGQPVQIVNKK